MAGRAILDRAPLRVLRALEHPQMIEVLPRRDVAQGEGLADHALALQAQRPHILDEDVAEAALEQSGGQRRGRNPLEFLAIFGG